MTNHDNKFGGAVYVSNDETMEGKNVTKFGNNGKPCKRGNSDEFCTIREL